MLTDEGEFVSGANVECASYGALQRVFSFALWFSVEAGGALTGEGDFESSLGPPCDFPLTSSPPTDFAGGAICAERTAIVKGVSEGKRRFVALAVTSLSLPSRPASVCSPCREIRTDWGLGAATRSDVNGMVSPCGICRQVLREFCPLEVRRSIVRPAGGLRGSLSTAGFAQSPSSAAERATDVRVLGRCQSSSSPPLTSKARPRPRPRPRRRAQTRRIRSSRQPWGRCACRLPALSGGRS